MKQYFTKNLVYFLLGVVLALAIFLRFYDLKDSFYFLSDENRDAIQIYRIATGQKFVTFGPKTSTGHSYFGPIYYYLMLPWLVLFNYEAYGLAFGMAVLGVVAVGLMFYVMEKMLSQTAALISSAFLAVSFLIVDSSRFGFHQNLSPLLSIIIFYLVFRTIKKPKSWYWVALCCGILLQLSYGAVPMVLTSAIIFIYQFIKTKQKKQFLQIGLIASLFIIGTYWPFFIFNPRFYLDFIFGGSNFKASNDVVFFSLSNDITWLAHRFVEFFGKPLFKVYLWDNRWYAAVVAVLVQLVAAITYSIKTKRENVKRVMLLCLMFLSTGLVICLTYNRGFVDHYRLWMVPVFIMMMACVLTEIWKAHLVGKIVVGVVMMVVVGLNLKEDGAMILKNQEYYADRQEFAQYLVDGHLGISPYAVLQSGGWSIVTPWHYLPTIMGDPPFFVEDNIDTWWYDEIEKIPFIYLVFDGNTDKCYYHPEERHISDLLNKYNYRILSIEKFSKFDYVIWKLVREDALAQALCGQK